MAERADVMAAAEAYAGHLVHERGMTSPSPEAHKIAILMMAEPMAAAIAASDKVRIEGAGDVVERLLDAVPEVPWTGPDGLMTEAATLITTLRARLAAAEAMREALKELLGETVSMGQHLVYNAPTAGLVAAMHAASAALAAAPNPLREPTP